MLVFSNKLLEKYNQNYLIKQYNSLNILNLIIKKRVSVNYAVFLQRLSSFTSSPTYHGLKRTKSSKITSSSLKKNLNSYSPYNNNMSFNNCSFIHYSTNKNNLLPQRAKPKITTKSMLVNKQCKLMSKIKKEHNIKFKSNSKSNLNRSFNSSKMKLNEINMNQEDNVYVPDNMIEIEYENSNDITESYINRSTKNNSIYGLSNSINSLRYPDY